MSAFPQEWGDKSVGTILREARETHGYTLDDAARVTRIGKNYLTALETDSYDRLPSPAYIKGFMRIYGGFLELSGDDIIARYEAGTVASRPAPEVPKPPPTREGQPTFRGKGRWYLPLLLLICVVVASLFFGEREERPSAPPPAPRTETPAPAAIQKAPTSARGAVSPTAPPATEGATPPKAPEVSPAPSAKGVFLKLKVNQDSALTITIDNSVSQQYDLKAGDLIEWKGERSFTLDLSNGGGVEAELNGKPLSPLSGAGKPAHVVLGADEAEKKSP